VHLEDEVPVLVLHVLEADIAQDASIVDEDIDAPKRLDGRLDDPVAILDAVVVGYCLAARGFDLVDDDICGLCVIVSDSSPSSGLSLVKRVPDLPL
jgi:hypothetical protein